MSIIKNKWNDFIYGNSITVILRIVLGSMFIFSGIFKVIDLETFGEVVARYGLLPLSLVPFAAIVMPFLELIVGFCLLIGLKIKASSLISIVLMLVFTIAIGYNVIRGENFDCGCFELQRLGIGLDESVSISLVIRDLIIIGLFLFVFRAERHLCSFDNYLENTGLKDL